MILARQEECTAIRRHAEIAIHFHVAHGDVANIIQDSVSLLSSGHIECVGLLMEQYRGCLSV